MFRNVMIIGLSVVCVGALLTLVLAQSGVPTGPPGGGGAVEALVSPDEREALGLGDPTWTAVHGKVHPDVYEVLEKGDLPYLRPRGRRPIGFEGTAYVEVHLRHEQQGKATSQENKAAIKAVQTRVLSRLTAAEFAVRFQFKNAGGLVGYVNAAGLAKLAKDPDVVGIGLDDKPVPKDPPYVTHPPSPRPEPGERFTPTPTKRIGKVEAAVYTALENSDDGYVYVIVCLTRVPLDDGAFKEAYEKKKAAVRKLQDRVLSELSANEFRVKVRLQGSCLTGYANAAGLAKLGAHGDVIDIGLTRRIRIPEVYTR